MVQKKVVVNECGGSRQLVACDREGEVKESRGRTQGVPAPSSRESM
jgi:hypothetical protein